MTTLLCFVRNLFFFLKPNNREKKILNLKHLGWKHHRVSVELHVTLGPLASHRFSSSWKRRQGGDRALMIPGCRCLMTIPKLDISINCENNFAISGVIRFKRVHISLDFNRFIIIFLRSVNLFLKYWGVHGLVWLVLERFFAPHL